MSGGDIIEEMGMAKKESTNSVSVFNLNTTQQLIVKLFEQFNELSIDDICEHTEIDISQILTELTILELSGIIRPTKNNQYIKII
ncbi:MAG: hypothetical protein WC422_03250 [Candidatus Paceibacterota bacterium]